MKQIRDTCQTLDSPHIHTICICRDGGTEHYKKQDKKYNATLWGVRGTIVSIETQQYVSCSLLLE